MNLVIYMKNATTNDEVKKLIILVTVVTGVFLAFYGITIFMNFDKDEEIVETPATVQYKEILLGNILNQKEEEYYVVLSKNKEFNLLTYELWMSNYEEVEESLKTYIVNIDSPFNDKFISDETNLEVDDINDLKVNDDALLKIEDNEVVDVIEGRDEIIEYFKELIEEAE